MAFCSHYIILFGLYSDWIKWIGKTAVNYLKFVELYLFPSGKRSVKIIYAHLTIIIVIRLKAYWSLQFTCIKIRTREHTIFMQIYSKLLTIYDNGNWKIWCLYWSTKGLRRLSRCHALMADMIIHKNTKFNRNQQMSMISTVELNSGEYVGIGIIEITSIPTLTILKTVIRKERMWRWIDKVLAIYWQNCIKATGHSILVTETLKLRLNFCG